MVEPKKEAPGKFVDFTKDEENYFRQYVKDDEERHIQYYIKMGVPASEQLTSFFRSRFGIDMPAEMAEELKLDELDRRAEKIAKSLGLELGYDRERINRDIAKDPFLSTKDPSQLSPEEKAEGRKRLDAIFSDQQTPKIHNLWQLLASIIINDFIHFSQFSPHNTQQEPAQLSSRQVPTAEEQHEMRARRQEVNEQMSAALHSAPASTGAAYDDEMAQQEQQQQSNGMSMGR